MIMNNENKKNYLGIGNEELNKKNERNDKRNRY